MKPEQLINWSELSRMLCGHRASLTPKRISKKQRRAVDDLLTKIQSWIDLNQYNIDNK